MGLPQSWWSSHWARPLPFPHQAPWTRCGHHGEVGAGGQGRGCVRSGEGVQESMGGCGRPWGAAGIPGGVGRGGERVREGTGRGLWAPREGDCRRPGERVQEVRGGVREDTGRGCGRSGRGGKSKISVPAGWFLVRVFFQGLQMTFFSLCDGERGTTGLFSFCIRSLISSRGSTLMTL